MRIGDLTLPVEVREWSNSSVVVVVPAMLVAQPTEAQLLIARADGTAAAAVTFELVMPASPALAGK